MSTKKEITITRALVELKRQDEKAADLTAQSVAFVAIGDAQRVPNMTAAEAEARIQSDIDAVTATIKRAQDIRNAIHASNAITNVTLGGASMTVAEAINLKKTVTAKRQHLARLQQLRQGAILQAARANEQVENLIADRIKSMTGKDGKLSEVDLELIRRNAEGGGKGVVVGLAKFDAKIKELADEVELIESELDFTLSESNAQTKITI